MHIFRNNVTNNINIFNQSDYNKTPGRSLLPGEVLQTNKPRLIFMLL